MRPRNISKFAGICAKISLNLPQASAWRWDKAFGTALAAFEKTDSDLIIFPLIKEFDHRWDFSSLQGTTGPFFEYFHATFGMIPGQLIFTTADQNGWTLFAVWWPWGDDAHISLRIGLYTEDDRDANGNQIREHLRSWLNM